MEILLVVIGLLIVFLLVWITMKVADARSVRKLWQETFDGVSSGDDISEVIARCGEPTEIVDNENGVLFLLTYGFVHREGEHTDISGCTRYSWIKQEWKGPLNGGYQTRAMHFFTKNEKIVFWYGHNLDMPGY